MSGIFDRRAKRFISKERGGVDFAAIYEGRRIEIAIDGRTDGIVLHLLALAYRKLLAGAVGGEGLGGIHRIEVDQTALVGIIDIQRNGKGKSIGWYRL